MCSLLLLKALVFASFLGIALAGIPPIKENIELPPPKENGERQNSPQPERQMPPIPDENGYYAIDDMRYNQHQYTLFYGTENEKELVRNAHPSPSARWTNGEMAYKFDSSVTSANQQMVKDCMDDFNKNFQGCLNVRYSYFVPFYSVLVTNYGKVNGKYLVYVL